MHLLLMFMNGVILDNALILRLAFLIISPKCLLKLSLLSTLIPNSFSQLVFKGPIYTDNSHFYQRLDDIYPGLLSFGYQ